MIPIATSRRGKPAVVISAPLQATVPPTIRMVVRVSSTIKVVRRINLALAIIH